jgi:hypothetical protein
MESPATIAGNALAFPHPTSFYLAGKSGSGKTQFIATYLRHTSHKFDTVQVCSRERQEAFENLPGKLGNPNLCVITHPPGIIPTTLYESFDPSKRNLLIVDDLFSEAFNSEQIKQVFVSGRHRNITVFLTSQNVFPPGGKHARNITLNANYIVIFRTRDLNQLSVLSRQIFGHKTLIQEAYTDAVVRNQYRYLIVDCSSHHNVEGVRLRTNVFGEQPNVGIICYNA